MEIFLVCLFSILGLIAASLNAALNSLNQERIEDLIDNKPEKAGIINRIWDNFEEFSNSMMITEFLLYFAGAVSLSVFITPWVLSGAQAVGITLVLVALIFTVRIFVYGFSKKGGLQIFSGLCSIYTFFIFLTRPLYLIQTGTTRRINGRKAEEEESRDDIEDAVEQAREEGSLDDDEYRFLKNIMKFSDILVSDVMTPRTVIFSCQADSKVNEVINLPEMKMYSRFPIWEGDSLDTGVIGYVMSRDILHSALSGKTDKSLRDFSREVYFIPENAPLDNALDRFLKRRQHLFVVVDEYGGVEGLLTMEDVLETMLGVEIVDEADRFVDMRLLAKQRRDRRISAGEK